MRKMPSLLFYSSRDDDDDVGRVQHCFCATSTPFSQFPKRRRRPQLSSSSVSMPRNSIIVTTMIVLLGCCLSTTTATAYIKTNNNDETTTSTICITSEVDFEVALDQYGYGYDDNIDSNHKIPPIEDWCVSISDGDELVDVLDYRKQYVSGMAQRYESKCNIKMDLLSQWERSSCDWSSCDYGTTLFMMSSNNSDHENDHNDESSLEQGNMQQQEEVDVREEIEDNDSSIVRDTGSITTVGSSATTSTTIIGSSEPSTSSSSSSYKSVSDASMPMIYRLMPLKVLGLLLLLSLVFVVRHMVDFNRYEGIDPSDQKIAEFELLQLAEEA